MELQKAKQYFNEIISVSQFVGFSSLIDMHIIVQLIMYGEVRVSLWKVRLDPFPNNAVFPLDTAKQSAGLTDGKLFARLEQKGIRRCGAIDGEERG
jgi:hypothetical protein